MSENLDRLMKLKVIGNGIKAWVVIKRYSLPISYGQLFKAYGKWLGYGLKNSFR